MPNLISKSHKLTFTFFDVGGGDAIWIRFLGDDDKWHNILIDGGYGYTYKDVFGPLIRDIIAEEYIDLWIITHTDIDHIGAVMGFIQDRKIYDKKAAVKQFWFNDSSFTVSEGMGKLGITQGIKLRTFLEDNQLSVKQAITTKLPTTDFFGLKITILSPSEEKLSIANDCWKEKERAGKLGRTAEQADHKKKIEELYNDDFSEDSDIWNGGSIACLIEFKDIRALLLSDSHPSTIVSTLKNKELGKHLPIQANLVQLAHHGSKGNNSQALLELIKGQTFVVTGNGITNQHPDKETLVRILKQNGRLQENLEFVFSSNTDALINLFSVDTDAFLNYKFSVIYPKRGSNFVQLDFLPIQ